MILKLAIFSIKQKNGNHKCVDSFRFFDRDIFLQVLNLNKSNLLTHIKIFIFIDTYNYMRYHDNARRFPHEELFIKGSYSSTETRWLV